MNTLKQLEDAPKNIVLYFVGLLGAVVDDYALMTLVIFCVLLGFITGSVLIPLATFFGAYFVLRLVANIADVIGFNARAIYQAADQQAHATAQVAAALSQPRPVKGTVVDGDILQ
jgi:hypothetical protein